MKPGSLSIGFFYFQLNYFLICNLSFYAYRVSMFYYDLIYKVFQMLNMSPDPPYLLLMLER